jgi:cytochrome c oxidase assembly factor CtaG
MFSTRVKRTAAITVVTCSLFAGAGIAPATASPASEALYYSALKTEWNKSTAADQKATCAGYKAGPSQVISLSVQQIWQKPAARKALSKPAWKRVITKYLKWACSGPGTTPR